MITALSFLSLYGIPLWGQSDEPSRIDALLLPFERSYTQAAAGEWKSSLNLLEQFAMRWHMTNPVPGELTRKVEATLNASARALLAAPADPSGVQPALADLSAAVGDWLGTNGFQGGQADKQFFTALATIAAGSLDSAQASRTSRAGLQVQLFDALWGVAEDAVHQKDAASYARIEAGIDNALSALKAQPADLNAARAALTDLLSTAQARARGTLAAQGPGPASGAAVHPGIPGLLALLDQTRSALSAGDPREASARFSSFIVAWPLAEGDVKARSDSVYARVESEMTEAGGLILSGPVARQRAAQLIQRMSAQLSGLGAPTSYTAWDAGMILLREGMEALLVLAALLAMLRKAEGRKREVWVWTGAGTGLVLSGLLAMVLGFVMAAATAGSAREQVEGFVGLASVGLMVTVGAWLHRRSSLQSWNAFIKNKVGGALATGRMWSIFALALLAVLREGAESVVFYIGIAPAISLARLLLGIGGALLVLVVIGFVITRFSVRLPLRWFFLVATLLIYYLAFKISGDSIHSLQVAGVLPAHTLMGLPSARFLGMYRTWETFAPQMAVLLYVLGELLFTEMRRLTARRQQAQAGPAGAPNR